MHQMLARSGAEPVVYTVSTYLHHTNSSAPPILPQVCMMVHSTTLQSNLYINQHSLGAGKGKCY